MIPTHLGTFLDLGGLADHLTDLQVLLRQLVDSKVCAVVQIVPADRIAVDFWTPRVDLGCG